MKIVRFLGGLGNQMFQYAFYKFLEYHFQNVKADLSGFNDYILHNGYELKDIFGIDLKEPSSLIKKLYDSSNREWLIRKLRRIRNLKNVYYEEQQPFEFDEAIVTNNKPLLYWGYWQNPNYIDPIKHIIEKDFQFIIPLEEINLSLKNEIETTNSVGIHIRRGDYISHPLFDNICNLDYYTTAINLIKKHITNAHFYIFSNDINWCRENIHEHNTKFIDWNVDKNSYLDMQLMSLCRHNIISNSSFSWWAAWLNRNPNKIIISPSKWINISENDYGRGIIPENWITI